jgi:GTP-binding protein Era
MKDASVRACTPGEPVNAMGREENAKPREGPSGEKAPEAFRSGYVSISGRPNVGKSTFLNTVLGQKVSIVTPKPQTTRNRIIGVKSLPHAQIVFVDTPGLHVPAHPLGGYMVREARQAIKDVDVVLFMVEPRPPARAEEAVLRELARERKPVLLLINKVDTVKKPKLLPVIDQYRRLYDFPHILPISALTGEGIDDVLRAVVEALPAGPRYYPDELVTDRLERFMVAEIIREKVMEITQEEVPHSVAVEVSQWSEAAGGVHIGANIFVEKDGQKGIIIGKRGERLKRIGTSARAEIEDLLDAHVFLELFVKVKKQWRTKKSFLAEMGYE